MKIGSTNNYNHINILAQKNKAVTNALSSTTSKKDLYLPNLADFLTGSTYDNPYANYSNMMKNRSGMNNTGIHSLCIDPNRPHEAPPQREFIEMLPIPQSTIDHRIYYSNPVNYANMFLSGLGDRSFNNFLSENDIELPEDATFNISVDGYGKVTVTGLDDEELTSKLQDVMSYDFPFIRSHLTTFVRSKRTIEENAYLNGMGMSNDQHWKMQINSSLVKYGVSLTDLSLNSKGKIEGLPESLYNKIYGDRTGMTEFQKENFDFFEEKIIYFLEKGAENVPTYEVDLTYKNGKIIVND